MSQNPPTFEGTGPPRPPHFGALEVLRPEFLTEDEAAAILRVPDRRTLEGRHDYAILLTLLTTGLRKAELCGLKIGDLKTYRNQAVIDVIGKGRKFRRIPLQTAYTRVVCFR